MKTKMSVETELYEILEVPVNATIEEIKKSYRKKVLHHHPDKGGDPEIFKKINYAYEILSNPEKRELYNKRGKNGVKDTGNVPNDIFATMFGNMFQKMDPFGNMFGMFQNFHNSIRKTQSTIYNIDVSLEDLCTRKVINLKVSRKRVCICCDDNKSIICTDCKGTGMIMFVMPVGPIIQQMNKQCNKCQGIGKLYNSCNSCQNGIIDDSKNFDIYLTPEMENGYKYILNNEGNQAKGYEPGDLILVITRKEHPNFQVKGNNLIYKKNITLKEALCGHSFDIIHPSGEILGVSTREVIDPETIQILPKGMTEGSIMEIHYKIIFPKTLKPEQIEIIYKNL